MLDYGFNMVTDRSGAYNYVIGNEHDAWRAVLDYGHDTDCDCGCARLDEGLAMDPDVRMDDPAWTKRIIGKGERRVAYLIHGIVYKVGRNGSCRAEYEAFSRWHKVGAAWAPETSLYEITDGYGDSWAVTAMPYLPDDGEVNETDLIAIYKVAPKTCPENWTSHNGHTYLIDGKDVDYWPPHAE